ncbi:hypothetical protein Tco_0529081 [Tanacetum coccineum]
MQVNVQFLQQLQPECSFKNEVNDIRSERLMPEVLQTIHSSLAGAQNHIKITSIRHKNLKIDAPSYKHLRPHDQSDQQHARRDKDMQKTWLSLTKYFKDAVQTYQQTTLELLQTPNKMKIPHQGRNKKINDNQSKAVWNHRTVTVDGARETSGQKTGITVCFNCKDLTLCRECRKPKRLRLRFHKEKLMMCKQVESKVFHFKLSKLIGLEDSDEGMDEQELDSTLQFTWQDSGGLTCGIQGSTDAPLEQENKRILKAIKESNASLTQELKVCKTNRDESSRALREATSSRNSSLIALQTKQTELEKYTA